jgi:hypothetical protein
MKIELFVALIASGTSLFVAIIGLITSFTSNRQSARSEKAIENVRYEISRLATKESISDTNMEEALKALRKSLQAIQLIKDETQVILSATNNDLNSKSAINRICAAREKMFACYEEELASLDDIEVRANHRAKNISLIIENLIKEGLLSQLTASNLSPEKRDKITLLRAELTEIQQVLRDSKTDRILRRIGDGK